MATSRATGQCGPTIRPSRESPRSGGRCPRTWSFRGLEPEPEYPGPNRWGWPTLNYFGAQLLATQHHFAGGFVPSMRPWIQFQTRYSRYVWAPDVKVVAAPQKALQVLSPEEVRWKRFVYRLATDQGYELIIHLVRIPPTSKWDVDWLEEPQPLRAPYGRTWARIACAMPGLCGPTTTTSHSNLWPRPSPQRPCQAASRSSCRPSATTPCSSSGSSPALESTDGQPRSS
jgi:hypothetical protein